MKYQCPLCGSALTERHYHEVVKVQAQKEKVQKGELEKLRKAAAVAEASAQQARNQDSGIFVVAQAGVITLARICRDSLIAMAKQRLDAAAKEAAAKRLMNYITSPVCRTPLEEAIAQTMQAHKGLLKEIKQHVGDWKTRHQIYQTISYDISHIQTNIERVLQGRQPLLLDKPVVVPLALPAN